MERLHCVIVDHYDREDLKTLCFELDVNYDALPGEGTVGKARELIVYLGRRRKLERLLDALRQGRPEAFGAAGLGKVTVEALYDALPDWEGRTDSPDRRALDVREAQIGVLGDHAHVEGGIHYHTQVDGDFVERNKHVHGDEVHGDKIDARRSIVIVAEHLTLGIRSLPYDYAARIRNFLTAYLGTPAQPVPFGGREHDLHDLDAWLDEAEAPPYLLLAAPAGRGKSALLVRWSQRLLAREDLAVVFVPVSVRYRTNLASVVFATLTARLAKLHGDQVPGSADTSVEMWRGMAADYLARPLPDGRRLLVILDGADEAADWQAGPDLFPLAPPSGLRVVLSARYLAGDVDGAPWLRRLGWERPRQARAPHLAPLTPAGVADVLYRMGVPLDQLGARVDVVRELHRLSEGDPLLVRLYVDDLWARGEAAARLQPEELGAIHPGLEGYFDRWWQDQRALWGDKVPLRERAVRALLNVLACALGPLAQADVLCLAPPEADLDAWTLEEALRPLARFVIGDGREQGYVFGHPKLGNYFYERLTRAERECWERRFLDWGAETLGDLNEGALAPRATPAYLVQYYGAHLIQAEAGPEALLALVSDGWRRAWEALEGAYGGFLNDVERAWQAAERADAKAAKAGRPAPYLGGEVRCALCRASVNSLARNIHPELLVALVENGIWTSAQGLVYACQMPEEKQQAEALGGLAPHLSTELLGEALAAARGIVDEEWRAGAIVGLTPHLPAGLLSRALEIAREITDEEWRTEAILDMLHNLPTELLEKVLVEAQEITSEGDRVQALTSLVSYLPTELLGKALTVAWGFEDEDIQAEALGGLVPHLPIELLGEALAAARGIVSERNRARVFLDLVPHLSQREKREEALNEALTAARRIESGKDRVEVLLDLVLHLSRDGRREAVLAEALVGMQEIKSEWWQAEALATLAPHLYQGEKREETLAEALAVAQEIESAWSRAKAFLGLVPHLPEGAQREETLVEALAAAREIESDWGRMDVLAELALHLPIEGQREEVLAEALVAARGIETELGRVMALVGLVPHLPTDLLGEALQMARGVESGRQRVKALVGLAPYLPDELLREALQTTRGIESERDRVEALVGLASHLPTDLLGEALQMARGVESGRQRVEALVGLAPHLPDELFREALQTTRGIESERERVEALVGLVSHLPAKLLKEALQMARGIEFERERAEALVGLVPHLPANLLEEALAVAREMTDKESRAEALTGLAPQLSIGGQRKEVLAEALEAARGIELERSRAEALMGLVPYLQVELLGDALMVARKIADERSWMFALWGLASRLPQERQREVLAFLGIADEFWRTKVLVELASRLPAGEQRDEALAEALGAAQGIASEDWRVAAIAVIAPCLQSRWTREAMTIAQEIVFEWLRAQALVVLAPHLPVGLLGEALGAARGIVDVWGRVRALVGLAPHLPVELVGGALEAAREIVDEYWQMDALAGLAPYLPTELLGEVLGMAREIEYEEDRAKMLAGLAPHLSVELLGEALKTAREIADEESQARALSGLAPYMPAGEQQGETLAEALAAVRRIEREGRQAELLSKLAPHLSAELLREALAAAKQLADEGSRARALAGLVPYLPLGKQREEIILETLSGARSIGSANFRAHSLTLARLAVQIDQTRSAEDLRTLLGEAQSEAEEAGVLAMQLAEWGDPGGALEAARQYEQIDIRNQSLAALAFYLAVRPCSELADLWWGEQVNLLHFLARRTREDFLLDIATLAPVIAALGGEEAIVQSIWAIRDVVQWWP